MRLSKIDLAKNVIFEDRAESEPKVYWEFRDFGVGLIDEWQSRQTKRYNVWWKTHARGVFEKMSAEFHFSPLTLIPCRRSLAQKRDKKITHYTVETSLVCTHETLLATNGLLAMLLHWATTAQIYRERRIHARRMLEDILRRVLSAADKKNAVWNMFTLTSIAERATRVLVRDDFYEIVATSTSRYEQIAYSLLYMFNNRKKDHSLWSYFVRCLNILTLCMNDIVLNRRVGQGSPDIRAPPKRKKHRAPPPLPSNL